MNFINYSWIKWIINSSIITTLQMGATADSTSITADNTILTADEF